MKKLMFAAIMATSMLAFAAPEADEDMKSAAKDPEVAKNAESDPDGVQILPTDDGSLKVISTGTGAYDFNDNDAKIEARSEAERAAKTHIVKWFEENFQTEESAQKAVKSAKSLTKSGKKKSVAVSQETIKTSVQNVSNKSGRVLTGIVVLRDENIPEAGGDEGGTIRVTVGFSSLTLAAAEEAGNAMTDSIYNRRDHEAKRENQLQAIKSGGSGEGAMDGSSSGDAGSAAKPNKARVRRSKGAF